jgi:hypothetical protein
MTIKILILHAGIGGNRKGWIGKDVEVTAVDWMEVKSKTKKGEEILRKLGY